MIKTVVHNLFRPRATHRYLKPFRGQTSATTPLCPLNTIMLNFMKMSCTVKHKVNLKSCRERDSLLLRYFYIIFMLLLHYFYVTFTLLLHYFYVTFTLLLRYCNARAFSNDYWQYI